MKNLVFAFALLFSSSLLAQFSYNSTNPTGIESNTNTASGDYSTAMGLQTVASGYFSTALGVGTTASGNFSTAMGNGTTASGNYSTAMGYETTASEQMSTAMGMLTTASGGRSTAMGNGTTASASNSTAMGYNTEASGYASTAMGDSTQASGNWSTAMGLLTTAEDYSSFTIGSHNKADETPNPSQFSPLNTAFVIGNGGFDSNGNYDGHLSNAFEVLFDGSTTIAGNVTAPAFIGDGSQLTNMPLSFNATSGNGIQSPTTTASGTYSTAMGYYTTANGPQSMAMGALTMASGPHSTAMGIGTIASGNLSTAMGWNTNAEDFGTTAIGTNSKIDESPNPSEFSLQNTAFIIGNGDSVNNRSNAFEVLFDGSTTIAGNVTAPAFIGDGSQLTNLPTPTVNYSDITNTPLSFNATSGNGIESATNTASGDASTALGWQTTASGRYSTAMGLQTNASGATSTAMGYGTQANGGYSTAMGYESIAIGDISSASGGATTAEDYLSFVIGVHNKTDETPNPQSFSYQNTAFVIGNGGYDSEGNYVGTSDTFSNALEVLFDGTTTIAGDLNINSDARLKANIISLGATLSKLLQIDGKTYTMKKDSNHKKKIGLLAQDIEKVFPELVTETNDIKSVNYQGLVPVLINAMKEQQDEIDSYKTELTNQRKEIDELKTMVKQLISK